MIHTPTLPFNALQVMDTMMQVEMKIAGIDNMIADSVRLAMHNGTPYVKIAQMLKSMAEDNYNAIADMIDEPLTLKLLSL